MNDSTGLARSVVTTVAAYPVHMARTLIQIGYEPRHPDPYGRLPNIFTYIKIIRQQHGYLSLYTGMKFFLPAVVLKKTSYDFMAAITNHKQDTEESDISEIIAVCLRESALKINSTIIVYPLLTLSIGYISTTFFETSEPLEYNLQALYKGIVPKLIVEVIMVWVSIISRRITDSLVDDELLQPIVSRIPPFIVQSLLYPLNVISTVMADNGKSKVNPAFSDWRLCYRYLGATNQLKRGSSFFFRRDYQMIAGGRHSIKRYF